MFFLVTELITNVWLTTGPREACGKAGHGLPEVCYLLLYKSTTFKMLFDPRMLSLIFHNDPELQQLCAIVSAKWTIWTLIDDAKQKTVPSLNGDGCVCVGEQVQNTTLIRWSPPTAPALYTLVTRKSVHCALSGMPEGNEEDILID